MTDDSTSVAADATFQLLRVRRSLEQRYRSCTKRKDPVGQRDMEILLDDLESVITLELQKRRKFSHQGRNEIKNETADSSQQESSHNDEEEEEDEDEDRVLDLSYSIKTKFALVDQSATGRIEVSRLLTKFKELIEKTTLHEKEHDVDNHRRQQLGSSVQTAAAATTTRSNNKRQSKAKKVQCPVPAKEQTKDPPALPSDGATLSKKEEEESKESDLDAFLALKNIILKIEKRRVNKQALLQQWRALQELCRARPGVKTCGEQPSLWISRRMESLQKIHRCIQICWNGDEMAYCQNTKVKFPFVDPNAFSCRRGGHCSSAESGSDVAKEETPETSCSESESDQSSSDVESPNDNVEDEDDDILVKYENLRNQYTVIERNKKDKRAILQAWRDLRQVHAADPRFKDLDRKVYTWFNCRSRILQHIENCIQTCWGGNEEAYCASSVPIQTIGATYHCNCATMAGDAGNKDSGGNPHDSNLTDVTETIHENDWDNGDHNPIRRKFKTLREKYAAIEKNKSDKRSILEAWRELKQLRDGYCSSLPGQEVSAWFSHRFRILHGMEDCIRTCWGGNEEAFCASSVKVQNLGTRYSCKCDDASTVGDPMNDNGNKLTIPPQIKHIHEYNPASRASAEGVSKESDVEKEFHKTRANIQAIEGQKLDKTLLLEAYTVLRREFSHKSSFICHSSRRWLKERLQTLEQVEKCIHECFKGDKEKYLSLSGWPELGRSCKCRCHVLKKAAKESEKKERSHGSSVGNEEERDETTIDSSDDEGYLKQPSVAHGTAPPLAKKPCKRPRIQQPRPCRPCHDQNPTDRTERQCDGEDDADDHDDGDWPESSNPAKRAKTTEREQDEGDMQSTPETFDRLTSPADLSY